MYSWKRRILILADIAQTYFFMSTKETQRSAVLRECKNVILDTKELTSGIISHLLLIKRYLTTTTILLNSWSVCNCARKWINALQEIKIFKKFRSEALCEIFLTYFCNIICLAFSKSVPAWLPFIQLLLSHPSGCDSAPPTIHQPYWSPW